jgi:basic membrane protein A and related proteins
MKRRVEMSIMKKVAAAAVLAVASLGFGTVAQAQATKVGFVYVSPVGDAGWTFQHDQGRKEMEKALGN